MSILDTVFPTGYLANLARNESDAFSNSWSNINAAASNGELSLAVQRMDSSVKPAIRMEMMESSCVLPAPGTPYVYVTLVPLSMLAKSESMTVP